MQNIYRCAQCEYGTLSNAIYICYTVCGGVQAQMFKEVAMTCNYGHLIPDNNPRHLKVKCTLVQALRLCTGRTTNRGSRGIPLLFHDQRH